jgi:hypothetical protein
MISAHKILVVKSEGKKPIVRCRLRFQILLAYKKYGVDEGGSILDRGIHFLLYHYIQTGSEACHILLSNGCRGLERHFKNIWPQYKARNPVSFGEKRKVPSQNTKAKTYFQIKCWPSKMEFLPRILFFSSSSSSSLSLFLGLCGKTWKVLLNYNIPVASGSSLGIGP